MHVILAQFFSSHALEGFESRLIGHLHDVAHYYTCLEVQNRIWYGMVWYGFESQKLKKEVFFTVNIEERQSVIQRLFVFLMHFRRDIGL